MTGSASRSHRESHNVRYVDEEHSSLDVFFSPRSIAVIGASRDPDSMAGTLWRNIASTFQGPLFPVNPHAADLDGRRAYPSILDVPHDVDLAFIVVPAPFVFDVARQCVEKKVRGVVVISAGFSETDAAGRERQDELRQLLARSGIRMIGPNCLGVLNTDPDGPVNGTFSLARPPHGNVVVCTQSGALGFVFPEYMRRWNVGLSKLVSIGNKADVGENDLIEHWGQDFRTDLIQLYLESFQNPRRFLEVARRVSHTKPIIAVKAGRSAAGERAAGSHTAALASPAAAGEGLLRQSGVIAVDSLEDLFETTALLAMQPLPRGRRVAILTNAGGPGVLCADAVESGGLQLPEFSPALQAELRRLVPAEASVRNPIDLIGATDPVQFRQCLELLLESPESDAVIAIYVPRLAGTTHAIRDTVREAAASDGNRKTMLTVFMVAHGEPSAALSGRDSREERTAAPPVTVRIPRYEYPEEAGRALCRAVEYAEWRARCLETPRSTERIGPHEQAELRRIVEQRPARADGWLPARDVMTVLRCAGLTVPAWATALTDEEAIDAATAIGFPVAIKALAPDVLHKSDVGGVMLDLRTPREVHDACRQLRKRLPGASEFLIQRFVTGGVETLVGVTRDPAFGHLIGFGSGGVLVEALNDVSFRLHPLMEHDADDLIRHSLVARLLSGHRGKPAADGEALRTSLLRVSALLSVLPEISELDLNPLVVLPAGQGISVLDARIRLSEVPG